MSTQPEDKKRQPTIIRVLQPPVVPHIVRKDSLAGENLFPHFEGINSHNIREYFPTIYGITGTNGYTYPRS